MAYVELSPYFSGSRANIRKPAYDAEQVRQSAGTAPANPWATWTEPPLPPPVEDVAAKAQAQEASKVRAAAPGLSEGLPAPVGEPYAGEPRPFVPSDRVHTWNDGGNQLRVEIPSLPMPTADEGEAVGIPKWQPAGAPGFNPVITPETARPLAAPLPPVVPSVESLAAVSPAVVAPAGAELAGMAPTTPAAGAHPALQYYDKAEKLLASQLDQAEKSGNMAQYLKLLGAYERLQSNRVTLSRPPVTVTMGSGTPESVAPSGAVVAGTPAQAVSPQQANVNLRVRAMEERRESEATRNQAAADQRASDNLYKRASVAGRRLDEAQQRYKADPLAPGAKEQLDSAQAEFDSASGAYLAHGAQVQAGAAPSPEAQKAKERVAEVSTPSAALYEIEKLPNGERSIKRAQGVLESYLPKIEKKQGKDSNNKPIWEDVVVKEGTDFTYEDLQRNAALRLPHTDAKKNDLAARALVRDFLESNQHAPTAAREWQRFKDEGGTKGLPATVTPEAEAHAAEVRGEKLSEMTLAERGAGMGTAAAAKARVPGKPGAAPTTTPASTPKPKSADVLPTPAKPGDPMTEREMALYLEAYPSTTEALAAAEKAGYDKRSLE